ncbi:MAG: cation diffusion facilitator family transporter [Candidatus Thorarchaeota archaeon]
MPGTEDRPFISRYREGETVAKVSVLAMIVLTVVKGVVGWTYHSVALLADALNSLSDILGSALIWSGLKLAGKPPNERFPYGYYRGETLASLFVSIMIVLSGVEILLESGRRLFFPEPITSTLLPLLAAALSAVTYYVLSRYKLRVGEKIGSSSLVADSTHSMVDVYAGAMVFVGIALSLVGLGVVEVLVALGLGVYIIAQGLQLSRKAVLSLMDAEACPEYLDEIKKMAAEIDGIVDVHDIRLRRAGPVCFGEMHLTVSRDLSIDEAHDLADKMENRLKDLIPHMETVTIHTEPEQPTRFRLAVPAEEDTGFKARVSRHFNRAPFFAIVDINEGEVRGVDFVENPAASAEKKRGILAVNTLEENHVSAVAVGHIGEGPFDILRAKHIAIYDAPAEARTVQDVLTDYALGRLERLRNPPREGLA